MTFEDLNLFITIGEKYEVRCEMENVVGRIIGIGQQAIVIEKESGKKKIIDLQQIISIDEEIMIERENKENEYEDNCEKKISIKIRNTIETLVDGIYDNTIIFEQNKKEIGLTEFQRFFLNKLDVGECNKKYFEGKLLVKGASYVGNGYEAKEDIDKLRKNREMYKDSDLCELYLLMTRIAYDSREYSRGDFIKKEYILTLLGEYFINLADYFLKESKSEDAAKCYYIEALKVLPQKGNEKLINKALNMLSYTFFTDTSIIKNELNLDIIGDSLELGKYYNNAKQDQNSVRDFLVTIFMLKDKKDAYYNYFIDEITKYTEFKSYVKDECSEILSMNLSELDEDFEDLLKDTYNQSKDMLQQLEDIFNNTVKEYDLSEKLKDRVTSIEKLRKKDLLLSIDDDYVNSYIKVLRDLIGAIEETNIDDKIEKYRSIVDETENDINELKEVPTTWGFCILKKVNTEIHDIIRNKVNCVYKNNRPKINIALIDRNNCTYIKDRATQVEVEIENEDGLLTADGLEFSVFSDDDVHAYIVQPITSIEGGTKASQIIKFNLTEDIIKKRKLVFNIICVYRFRLDFENMSSDRIEVSFEIDLNNEKSFVEIENMYDKILNGSGCAACPQMFKGRDKLINKLCNSMYLGNDQMNKNRGIVLWGQRRVGKNSVKDSFKNELQKRYPGAYIHIDIGSTGVCAESFPNLLTNIARHTERTLRNLAKDAKKRMEKKEELSNDEKKRYQELIAIYEKYQSEELEKTYLNIHTSNTYVLDFDDYIKSVVGIIVEISGDNRNIPIFYIDEFTYFFQWIKEGKVDGRKFMQFIKSFISDNGICAVLLAQDNMPIWKEEYSNEFNCMDFDNMITYLDYDGAKELICEPCQLDGKSRFSQDAVQYIFDITKGSAYLIDILCGAIIDYLNEMHTERVSKKIVEIVLQSWIAGEKDFFSLSTFEPQYEDTSKVEDEAKKICESNLELLTEIAVLSKNGANVNIEEINFLHNGDNEYSQKVFELLVDRKILEIGKGTCRITMPLFMFALLKEKGQMDKAYLNYYND